MFRVIFAEHSHCSCKKSTLLNYLHFITFTKLIKYVNYLYNAFYAALHRKSSLSSPNYPNSYNSTAAYRGTQILSVSSAIKRLVFVVTYVNLSMGDTVSIHNGYQTVSGFCSVSPSDFLRSYLGEIGQMKDVVYASNDYSCVQFHVVGTSSRNTATNNGYYIDIYGKSDNPQRKEEHEAIN